MLKQPELNETFKHFRSGDGFAYMFLTIVFMVVFAFVAYESFLLILFVGCIGLTISLLSFLIFGAQVTLTTDGVIKHGFGVEKQEILYKDIYKVHADSLTLVTKEKSIRLDRDYDDYERLYALLRQRISLSAFNDHMTLPWKLRMRATGFGNGEREILFTDEAIFVNQNNHEDSWAINQIQRIYTDGGPKYRGFTNIFDAIIKIKGDPRIVITNHQIRGFKFTPEQFVANLQRLYPHTAPPLETITPSVDWLVARGHHYADAGNVAGAIKLYEQALTADRYQWLVWQQLGMCHLQLGNYQDAAESFREAITLNIEDVDSFYNGAVAYSQVGDKLKTRVYLQEALTLQPEMKEQAQQNPFLQNYL